MRYRIHNFILLLSAVTGCGGDDTSTEAPENSAEVQESAVEEEISYRDQLVHYSTGYYEYDDAGNVILIRQEDSLGREQSSTEYKYDGRGNLLSCTVYQPDGIDQWTDYIFDSKGKIIESHFHQTGYASDRHEKFEYTTTQLVRSLLRHDDQWRPSIYEYHPDGRLKSILSYESEDTSDLLDEIQFNYDSLGRFLELIHNWEDGSFGFKDSVAYNERGLISDIFRSGPSVSKNHILNTYNAENLLETVTNIDYYDKKDEFFEYTYNDDGKIATVTVYCQRHFHDNMLLFLRDQNYLNTDKNIRQFYWAEY